MQAIFTPTSSHYRTCQSLVIPLFSYALTCFDAVVEWCMQRRWFERAGSFSFFIYGLHMPLLAYTTAFFFIYANGFKWYRLGTYLFAPLCILLFCIATGALLRKLFPKVYKVVTGGRGF